MRYTLLDLTQNILSSMDSDEVNSITDTVESMQVVNIIKTVYDDIQSRGDLAIQKSVFNLDASGTSTKPVLMTKPSSIDHIIWIKYNKVQTGDTDPSWAEIRFLPIEDFIQYVQGYAPSETYVDTFAHTVNGFTFTFHYRNDVGPSYYTSFNDNTVIFDSYDSVMDTTLQTSKTLCYGELSNSFTVADNWIPNLQPQQFSLLLNEAKSLAWTELKQTAHPKAEQTARRNWRHIAKAKSNVPSVSTIYRKSHPLHMLPNFGRK